MWYLSLLFILFLIIIFTYFVKEYRRYRLELDKTLLEYHSYVVKMDKLEKENISTKLEKVNDFFNNVGYGDDKKVYGVNDYWATPYEFLARDKGDCEDYVIGKYFALKHLGIPTSKMFLSYVKVKGATDTHMVLSYFESPNSEPLILDSLRKIIFPASKRDDLTPIYNFNPNILDKGSKTAAHRKWDVVLKNFREKKI